MSTRYGAFFRRPGASWLGFSGALGRLPDGMINLALVLVIEAATGSYAIAGAGTAAHAIAAGACAPFWGRAVDRVGPRRVVALTGVADAAVLAGLFLAAGRGGSAGLLVGLAAASGVARPPVGTVTRTVWSRTFGEEAREVAFTFEAGVSDIVFIAGPAIVAGLATVAAPRVALLVAGVTVLVGCLSAASARIPFPPPEVAAGPRRHWLGPLRHVRVLAVVPVGMLGLGSISMVEIATVAFSDSAGNRDASGILLAVLSAGGLAGGLYWAARRQPGTHAGQMSVLLLLLGAGWFVLSLAPGLVVLGVLLALAGLVLNPVTATQTAIVNDVAPRNSLPEAFGWLTAAEAAGEALGAPLSGVLVDRSPDYGFWLAAVAAGVAAVLAFALLTGRKRAPRGSAHHGQ